ncbi:MAG TPA: DUF4112 domain-containing protein [Kofleriaceae bacterium]|nr:DUF4112 domain-containing protein [Kofleriaceae bacterium]
MIGSAPYKAPSMPAPSGTRRDTELDRVRSLAKVLDQYFLDPVLGLIIPGGGDVLGAMLGTYVVMIAARRKVSPVIIARMLMNLAADTAFGIIPLFGDIFDFKFKANLRNVALLEERSRHGGRATVRDWLILISAICAFIGVLALVIWGVVALVRRIF